MTNTYKVLPLFDLNFTHQIQNAIFNKASIASEEVQQKNLFLNFIANKHQFTMLENSVFQSTGLSHLLAVSGGQIGFILNIFLIISALPFLIIFYAIKPTSFLKHKSFYNSILSLILALIFGCTFGGNGSLLRVIFLSYLAQTLSFQRGAFLLSRLVPYLCFATSSRILSIILLSFCLESPFNNYSFLLSSLGANIAKLSNKLIVKIDLKTSGSLNSIQKNLFSAIFTCIFMGFIMSPFQKISILKSVFANIICSPVINLLIVPLSFITIIIPQNFSIQSTIIHFLDLSLQFIWETAKFFGNPYQKINKAIFSDFFGWYLLFLDIALWSIIDYIDAKINFDIKSCGCS